MSDSCLCGASFDIFASSSAYAMDDSSMETKTTETVVKHSPINKRRVVTEVESTQDVSDIEPAAGDVVEPKTEGKSSVQIFDDMRENNEGFRPYKKF